MGQQGTKLTILPSAVCLSLLLVSGTLFSGAAVSETMGSGTTVPEREQQHTVTLVTGPDYGPYTDPSLPNGGYSTELMQTVFEQMGTKVKILFRPWKRGYAMVQKHEALGTFPYIWDAIRAKSFLFSDSIEHVSERFFVNAKRDTHYSGPEDLRSNLLCRPIGYSLEGLKPHLIDDEKHLWRPLSLSKCFQLLKHGRVHLVPINQSVGWFTIHKANLNRRDYKVLDFIINQTNHHFIISKTYPNATEILSGFNNTLKKLTENGTRDKIYRKHIKGTK